MATITRVPRKTGAAYRALVRLQGLDPFSKTFRLKKDAKTWALRMERNIDEALAFGSSAARSMTLADLIEEYASQWQGKSALPGLVWWKKNYGKTRLIDLTQAKVREGLHTLAGGKAYRGHRGGDPQPTARDRAPATVNRYKSNLSAVFEYGREQYDLSVNPCRGIKRRPENNARIRFLSEDTTIEGKTVDGERTRLLKACKASDWGQLYLLVLMAITTGARQGELLGLRWRDLRLQERRAYVQQTKNGEPRVLPLTDNVIELLQGLPRPLDGRALLFQPPRKPCKPGKTQKPRDPFKRYEFRKHWDKAVAAAQLENFRFHDLRHTCASYLAQNGGSLLQIADVLGHKQLEVTKRYSHLCVDNKQELVDRVLGGVK